MPAHGQNSAAVSWDPSPSLDVAGYRIHYGTATQGYTQSLETGTALRGVVSGLELGRTYYFAVTAYGFFGQESDPSAEVAYTPEAANLPPTIEITAPPSGTTFRAPATIPIAATVQANGHTINRVQFLNGTTVLGEDTTAPYTFTWSNVPAGTFNLAARATYDGSLTLTSSTSPVIVTNAPLPAITLTSPSAGATFRAPATLPLAATVQANGHTINRVQFLNGATVLGEDLTAPYTFTWSNAPAGTFNLAARATYDGSLTLTSSTSPVIVTNAPLPAITLTSPASGTTFRAPASVSLTATVQTNGNTINRVQFLNGATVLGEDLTAPYAFTWNNVPAGNPSLSARAVYGSGATVTSTQALVSVESIPQPWQSALVGALPPNLGSAAYSNGVFTVIGSGTISGTADSFRYLHQSLLGNGEITFKIQSPGSPSPGAAFGAMIRESLTPGSRFALLVVSPDGSFRWQTRTNSGGPIITTSVVSSLTPNTWIRLVRNGNTIQAFRSATGVSWNLAQESTLTLSTNTYVGTAVASGASNTLNTVTFSNVTVTP